jgi:hypothetical protein
LSISNQDTKTEAETEGKKASTHRRGEVLSVGVSSLLTDDFAIGLRLGYGEVGSKSKYYDRVFKLLPKYIFYRLNQAGGFYATAGLGAHSILLRSVENTVYTGAASLGYQNDLNAAKFKIGFELLYEQSFKSDDYKIGDVAVKNYKFNNLEATVSIGYKL